MANEQAFDETFRKQLRRGHTTGTCAAAAAKAATELLCSGEMPTQVQIITPDGTSLTLAVEQVACGENTASCAVRKDAGDDPDVTDGILVYAQVQLCAGVDIIIDGGEGVGRVTRAGLDQPVNAAAINRVPREMIERAVREQLRAHHSVSGARVIISIPDGRELAAKTYNGRLGIEGGLSVLGTSGIVEPMSMAALVDTIRAELNMMRAESDALVVMTPGSYGERFCRETLRLRTSRSVLCSNFVGDALDHAVACGFKELLLVGHIGKFVKLAGGIFNTHSHTADARMEILAAHTALAGGAQPLVAALLDADQCVTTDAALELIAQEGLLQPVMTSLLQKAERQLLHRAGGMPVGLVLFSNERGMLGMSETARRQLAQEM